MVVFDDFSLTQFDFLRHGECEGGDIFRGATDVALTPAGFANMRNSCVSADTTWDHIVSSPLQRCRQFAETLAQERQLPLDIDERLAEMRFGRWEGQLRTHVWQTDAALIQAWVENPAATTPPDGEPLAELTARARRFFDDTSARLASQKILVVTHGGLLRAMLATLLNMPPASANQFDIPYASLSRVKIYAKDNSRLIKLAAHNFVGNKA